MSAHGRAAPSPPPTGVQSKWRSRICFGCSTVAVWINTPLDLARSRNAARRGLARISDEPIAHVFEHLEPPPLEEGLAEVIEVKPEPLGAEPHPDGCLST